MGEVKLTVFESCNKVVNWLTLFSDFHSKEHLKVTNI